MTCNHKFMDYLNLTKIKFNPIIIIVGTFNPTWPLSNKAEWFYGRTQNNYFWDVLPKLYKEQSLIRSGRKEWTAFCERHKIAITDLISSIDDADMKNEKHYDYLQDYSDSNIIKHFKNITNVDIVSLLRKYKTVKAVYFTRSCSDSYWKKLWKPIKEYCDANDIKCKTLLTPSGNARFQLSRYKKLNPKESGIELSDFILKKWKEQW